MHYGKAQDIIPQLVKEHNIDAIYRNESYGHGAVSRDAHVMNRCRKHNISYDVSIDFLLVPIDAVPVRKVFTPFFKLRQKHIEANPKITEAHNTPSKIASPSITLNTRSKIENLVGYQANNQWPIDFSHTRLAQFSFSNYSDDRNIPSLDGTSRLSPYIRFGLISIRQLYNHALSQ